MIIMTITIGSCRVIDLADQHKVVWKRGYPAGFDVCVLCMDKERVGSNDLCWAAYNTSYFFHFLSSLFVSISITCKRHCVDEVSYLRLPGS